MLDKVFSKWFLICLLVVAIGLTIGIRIPSIYKVVENVFNIVNRQEFPLKTIFTGGPIEVATHILTLPIDTLIWIIKLLFTFRYV